MKRLMFFLVIIFLNDGLISVMNSMEINIKLLKENGFKCINKNRYTYISKNNQFISLIISEYGLLMEVDGQKILSDTLSTDQVIKIINILFNESG